MSEKLKRILTFSDGKLNRMAIPSWKCQQHSQTSLLTYRQLFGARCRGSIAQSIPGLQCVGTGENQGWPLERLSGENTYYSSAASLSPAEHSAAHRLDQAWTSQAQPSPSPALSFCVNFRQNIPRALPGLRSPGSRCTTGRCNQNSQTELSRVCFGWKWNTICKKKGRVYFLLKKASQVF